VIWWHFYRFYAVDQEGRLFKPLAYSKNLAMAIAAILAITLDPAIRMLFARMDYKHFNPAGYRIFITLLLSADITGRKASRQQDIVRDI
jgi:Cu/Ag efflux pump CusA